MPKTQLQRHRRIQEGETYLLVPESSLKEVVPPRFPAFYNPLGRLSRDVSIAIYNAVSEDFSSEVTFADCLSGVGARGVRVAVEVPGVRRIFINDINPAAVKLARQAAKINRVASRCSFSTNDACQFLILHSSRAERFAIVDVDPFGSPSPFIDCAIRAAKNKGVLSITATDAAVLCGVYPRVAWRRYLGYSLRTDYCHEIGMRLLYGLAAMTGGRLEFGLEPIFAHSTKHYMRVYFRILKGASTVRASASQLGYIQHCFSCDSGCVGTSTSVSCSQCGGALKTAGPLWIGSLYNRQVLRRCLQSSEDYPRQVRRLFQWAIEELDQPTYFVIDKMADRLTVPTPPVDRIVAALIEKGYRASRCAINPRGIKTSAEANVVRGLLAKGRV